MKRTHQRISVACLGLVTAITVSTVKADNLYFTQDAPGGADRLISVNGLARNAGPPAALNTAAGYVNVDTGDPGINVGVIDAAFVGAAPTVAIGGDVVRSYDGANINNLNGAPWDPDGPPVAGVDAIAIGDFGTLTDKIVISRETGPGANDVLVMSTDALSPGMNVGVAGGPTGGGTAHGLVLADFQPATPGNEALIGFMDDACAAPGCNGHQLFYNTGGNSGQFFLNSPITDVAAGDLNGNAAVDYVLTGNNPMGLAPGQGTHVFESNGAAGIFLNGPGLGGPHAPPAFNAVAIGNLDADADNEMVLVGNDFVRVLDNDGAGCMDCNPALFQSGPAGGGAQFLDVVIADADGDGVNEVVSVTDNGLVFMFGHSVVGDASSPFAGGPIGLYQDGGGTSFLGVASLVPEPGAGLLLLAGMFGLSLTRRRPCR